MGIQVPFVVDVLAPNYPPASSKQTKLVAGQTEMTDIVLGEQGAAVVVEYVDKTGSPAPDATVILLADPAGLPSAARGSWFHARAFRQRAVTSALGNARFSGVPPGRIIVRVKNSNGVAEHRGIAVSGQELQIRLWMP